MYRDFGKALSDARRLGVNPREIKIGNPIDGFDAYVGAEYLGHFPTREAADAAHSEAVSQRGFVVRSEQQRLNEALITELDAMVTGGLLTLANGRAELIEDRYRLPVL